MKPVPALTLVVTFKLLAFAFCVLFDLAADLGLFTIGSPWIGSTPVYSGSQPASLQATVSE